jgi:hypothetical protein
VLVGVLGLVHLAAGQHERQTIDLLVQAGHHLVQALGHPHEFLRLRSGRQADASHTHDLRRGEDSSSRCSANLARASVARVITGTKSVRIESFSEFSRVSGGTSRTDHC